MTQKPLCLSALGGRMKKNFIGIKTKLLPALLTVGLGSSLLSSCANTKPGNLSPSNPAHYNPDSREFESRWPFGPGGYR
jgi:hypothetical protein